MTFRSPSHLLVVSLHFGVMTSHVFADQPDEALVMGAFNGVRGQAIARTSTNSSS
jgi:hypothetical protein